MALSTVLDIIKRACDELGLPRPSTVATSTKPQDIQMFAFANAAGRDLLEAHEWSVLQTLQTVTTANGTSDYSLASDYDRMVSDTWWNATRKRFVIGPDNQQIQRFLNDGWGVAASVNQRFSIHGSTLTIWPTPTATETTHYVYISNKWARSSGSAAQEEFAADTDTSVFDGNLLKAEIKWRFMSAKGMYSDGLRTEAMMLRDNRIAADLGGTVLDMLAQPPDPFIGLANIPDGSWSV